MPIVKFTGFITPPSVRINATGGPLEWADPILQKAKMSYSIKDSRVEATCEVQSLDEKTLNILHIWAFHLVRGIVDVIAFSEGMGITVAFEYCKLPGQLPMPMAFGDRNLAALCSITVDELIRMTDKERGILKHLHDLAETLKDPLETTVNCARAVEGLCRLLSTKTDKAERWKEMQDSLNLSKSYLTSITSVSTERRHGSIHPQNLKEIGDTQERAWTVAGRFLEFRKRGSTKLPLSEFPLL